MTRRTGRARAWRKTYMLGSTALALATGFAGSAALAAEDDQAGVERIVVTATFRETDVQDTPIAITAVSSAMMEARSQTNVFEIATQAPNVTLKPGNQGIGAGLIAYIRGVGQTDFNLATEPGVGVYVDDVYYSSITGNVLDLLDLERVEVLRGPQGTLAGRNSIGGAIKLFTRAPSGDGDGYVEGTYGTFDRVEFRGGADFTIVEDKLFARIAGVSRTREGYVDQLDFTCLHPDAQAAGLIQNNVGMDCQTGTLGGESYTGGRFSARWLANERLEVNFAADIINDRSEAQASVLRHATVFDPAFFGFGDVVSSTAVPIYFDVDGDGLYDADNGDLVWQPGEDIGFDNRFLPPSGEYLTYSNFLNLGQNVVPTQCQFTDGSIPPFLNGGCKDLNHYKPVNTPPINHLDAWTAALTLDYELSPNFSLKSITAFRRYENTFAQDTDGSPMNVQSLLQTQEQEQLSQEVRLNGTVMDERLDFTVGAFWQDRDGTLQARVDLPYTAFDFIHGPDPTPSQTLAGFLDGTLHVTDRLDVSAGVRHTEDEKDYIFHRHNPDGSNIPNTDACGPPPWIAANPDNCAVAGGPPPAAALDGLPAHFESTRTDYRFAVAYDLTDNIMVYGQTSTGYKGGGINARPFVPDQAVGFDPETLTAYELGLKSRLFNNLARVNTAVFFNEYEDIILTRTNCAGISASATCLLPFNAGNAEVQGFELETEIYPVDGLVIDASFAALDFEYTEIVISPSPVTLDMIAPYTPETAWSLGAQYEFNFIGGSTLTPRIDAAYQSEVFTAPTNDAESMIDDYTVANARLTWRSPDDTWSASFFGTNIFDEFYFLSLTDQTDTAGFGAGTPGRPQEWGVTVRRNF
jgi:iron complex outermembrane receptor protein